MQIIRKAEERGPTRIGWLDSKHTFSFGGYRDPAHAGFGDLLVINEDRVVPGGGFGTHGHSDMEIISYVVDGGRRRTTPPWMWPRHLAAPTASG